MSTSCRPAITPARPARTSRPGSRWRRRALRGGLADPGRRQPDAGGARPGLLPPVRGQLQPHAPRQRGQHPRRRALPRRSRHREGLALRARGGAHRASASWWSAPARSACPPPTTSRARARGRDPRRRTAAGRHDALRHPRLPHAARRARGRDREIEELGVKIVHDHKVEDLEAEMTDGRFDAASSRSARISARRPRSRRATPARCSTPVSFLREVETHEAPEARPGRGLRRRQHGHGRGARGASGSAHEAMIIYRRDRAHMPAHAFEADEGRGRGREDPLAAHHQVDRRDHLTVEVMEVDEQGRRSRPGSSRRWRPTR